MDRVDGVAVLGVDEGQGLGAVVGAVADPESSPFRAGDRILAAAGEPVDGWVGLAFRLAPAARAGETVAFSVSNLLDGTVREVSAVPARQVFPTCRDTGLPSPFGPDPAGRPLFLAHDGLGIPLAIEPATQCLVSKVFRGSPGDEAGIEPGDVVAALEGVPVLSVADFQSRVRNSGGRTLALSLVGKDDVSRDVAVTPREMAVRDGEPKRFMVGIEIAPAAPSEAMWAGMLAGFAPVAVDASVPQWARARLPADQLEGDAKSIWRVLGPLVGKAHKGERARIGLALGGPVIILKAMWSWFLVSFAATLAFVRFLNVNLAIINLLPLPVLDGGHVVFALWRGATGRELPPRVIEALVSAFTVLILLLFLWLSLHDVWSISKLVSSR